MSELKCIREKYVFSLNIKKNTTSPFCHETLQTACTYNYKYREQKQTPDLLGVVCGDNDVDREASALTCDHPAVR